MKRIKVFKDTPLAEITLRKYEKPGNLKEREAVKKVCLSLGLLQPGDSRDVIVDVLHVLLSARKKREFLAFPELEKRVIKSREKNKLELYGIASSNIRRQLKRLKDILLAEKIKKSYRIVEFASLNEIFSGRIEKFMLQSAVERVREYLKYADSFSQKK